MMNKKDSSLFQMELLKVFMQLKINLMDVLSPITHEYDLNLVDTMVLYAISESNDLTVGDVYKSLHLNQGNFSTMCKKMEKKDLLIRTRDKKDQRTVILEITHKGEDTLNKINDKIKEKFKEIEENSKEDFDEAIDGLECFAKIIEKIHSKIEE